MKKWFQSKTIWTNILAACIAFLTLVDHGFLTAVGVTDKVRFLAIVGAITTTMNVILRIITNKGIDTSDRK